MPRKQTFVLVGLGIAILVAMWFGFFAKRLNAPVSPAPAAETLTSRFSDEDLGLEFSYPAAYSLTRRDLEMQGKPATYLTLLPSSVQIPQAGEAPPGITVIVVENGTNIPLADWLHAQANNGEVPAGGWDYQEVTVAGKRGIAYTSTGLYESDNVAVAHGGLIYIFSAAWLSQSDETRSDLARIIDSVTLE